MCYPTFKMGNVKCRTLYMATTNKVLLDKDIHNILVYFRTQRGLWTLYLFQKHQFYWAEQYIVFRNGIIVDKAKCRVFIGISFR